MYISPIEIISGQFKTEFESDILKAVKEVGINVDKQELMKALSYDRNQYKKGFNDAEKKYVIHAKWIDSPNGKTCSYCDNEIDIYYHRLDINDYNRCPCCGAIMDLKEK